MCSDPISDLLFGFVDGSKYIIHHAGSFASWQKWPGIGDPILPESLEGASYNCTNVTANSHPSKLPSQNSIGSSTAARGEGQWKKCKRGRHWHTFGHAEISNSLTVNECTGQHEHGRHGHTDASAILIINNVFINDDWETGYCQYCQQQHLQLLRHLMTKLEEDSWTVTNSSKVFWTNRVRPN